MSSALPSVSVIMPVVNEERHLAEAVQQILRQDYAGPLEIVIAVGPSRDRTADVAAELAANNAAVHVVANPTGKTPAGLNAAIAGSSGEIVVRVDGHAMVPSTYVSTGVETLLRTGADNVGGVMAAEGTSAFEQAVATAMRSRFGVGDASFHVGGVEAETLTVYLGCFRREALERVGYFDESMERAQDWELNLRIRQSGGLVWFTPAMEVTYRPRHSLPALARQYHDYGRWRREIVRRHPQTLSVRYLAAPITVTLITVGVLLAILGLLLGLTWLTVIGLALPCGYVVATIAFAILCRHVSWQIRWRLPAVFATMHLAWGTGFLRGPGRVRTS
jgi:succinoglycan biosynthesis protein ExoA